MNSLPTDHEFQQAGSLFEVWVKTNLPQPCHPFGEPGTVGGRDLVEGLIPRTIVATLDHTPDIPTSMDFHPQERLLLVGTGIGNVILWDITTNRKIASRSFNIWEPEKCSKGTVTVLALKSNIRVNRVKWSHDGALFGIAYSMNLVHVYYYHEGSDVRNRWEIDAHQGSVSDLAFSRVNGRTLMITCGDDHSVKVWDIADRTNTITLQHKSPIFSICPFQSKQNVLHILSTSMEGNIVVWSCDNGTPVVTDYAPGRCCTRFTYHTDSSRLFSCGRNERGIYLIGWNDREEFLRYVGLENSSSGIHIDIFRSHYLAAGDNRAIKIWDMDYTDALETIELDGLQTTHCFQFNKQGALLAVMCESATIQILVSAEEINMLHENEAHENVADVVKIQMVPESGEVAQCRSLRLIGASLTGNISRLTYSHSGNFILALASCGSHSLWQWKKTEQNLSGKVTTTENPRMPMSKGDNVINKFPIKNKISSLALSKNDCYVVSLSGESISLFDTTGFPKLATFSFPPPQPTCVVFHPNDNMVAIGMNSSFIYIYSIQLEEVKADLQGHGSAVTSLAFSTKLRVLVSAGADLRLCVWAMDEWKLLASKFLPIPVEAVSPSSGIHIAFHPNLITILAVHRTLLAVYKAPDLEYVTKWMPDETSHITSATYSCDGQSVYTCFGDGRVGVLTLTEDKLSLKFLILSQAYIPSSIRENIPDLYATVLAAHPSESHQFAVGFSDGSVYVVEPFDSGGLWGTTPPLDPL